MKITVFLSLILSLSFAAGTASASEMCFTQEINSQIRKPYQSVEEYNSALQEWKYREPRSPGIIALARAYAVYSKERAVAEKISYDKRAHCYVGCRISQELDYRTAEYVGWYKEDKDLKDCNKNSQFEVGDFDATVEGAQMGQSQIDAAGCMAACTQRY